MCPSTDLPAPRAQAGREPSPQRRGAGPSSRDTSRRLPGALAASYAPIIRRMALRLRRRLPSHVFVDDLVGAGFIGLIDAYRRYDPARCDRFEGYAELRIRGAMLDEIRSYDHLSRDMRALATRVSAVTRRHQARFGQPPTDAEVAAELGLPLDTYRSCAAVIALGPAVSADTRQGDADSPMEIGDPAATSVDEEIAGAESKRALRRAMEALPERLCQVVQLYYGEAETLRNIGGMFGVTESRACQLRGEAIARLRAALLAEDDSV